jgi:hypothetical protein
VEKRRGLKAHATAKRNLSFGKVPIITVLPPLSSPPIGGEFIPLLEKGREPMKQ